MKKIAVAAVLAAAVFLSGTGRIDRFLEWSGVRFLSQANDSYLDRAFDKSLTGFIILSSIKSGLAVVEGATAGVGVQVELGDIVQPIYDYVDIAWKAALAGGVTIVAMQLALKGMAFADQWVLALVFTVLALHFVVLWFFPAAPRPARWLMQATRFCATLWATLFLLLPLSVLASATLSRQITRPMIDASEQELRALGDFFSVAHIREQLFAEDDNGPSVLDLPGKIAHMGKGIRELTTQIKARGAALARLTLRLIAAYLFDCILFPLFFGLVLMTMLRSGVRFLFVRAF